MKNAVQRYRIGDPDASVSGLPEPDKTLIAQMLGTITDPDGHVRHQKWLSAIATGDFSFGKAKVDYTPTGVGSWKYQALGTEDMVDRDNVLFPYHSSFLKSDWKMFHDALQAHHFYVTHDLLPRYGICVA